MGKHDVNILIKARDEASNKLRGMVRSLIGFGAAFVGVRAGIRFVQGSVDAWTVQEDAVNKLRAGLQLLGQEAQAAAMGEFASKLQQMTTVGDETTLQLMSLGATMGKLSGDDLKQATVAAIGLSKAFGIDLNAAMRLVARAANGDTGTLKKYGIVLDENSDSTAKFNQLLTIGREKFVLAQAETRTFSGQFQMLKNSFGDARESLGKMIVGHSGLSDAMVFGRTVIENFGTSAQLAFVQMKLSLFQFWSEVAHGFADVVPAYLTYFKENWKNIFQNVWNFSKTVFLNMWENIKEFFTNVWNMLRGDAFDFTWKGLTEGFDNTLAKLPEIADRRIGALEQMLSAKRDLLAESLGKSLGGNMTGQSLGDFGGMAAAGGAGGGTGPGGASRAGVAALESRFLAGRSMAVDYDKESFNEQRESRKILAEMRLYLKQMADGSRPGGGSGLAVARL